LNLRTGVFLVSFNIIEILRLDLPVSFIFDFFSYSFRIIVCLISGVVIGYSIFYMGVLNSNRFVYLVFLFSLSIIFLIFRGNFFLMILGWDGLGVVSFALVIYYQNEISLKRGLLTIFMNRFGDGAMIFFLCLIFPFERGVYLIGLNENMNFYLGVFLFILACFTKRAQFPFMS
jgi:NADH-ubiquinone oxidoreductase chain 5